MAAEKGKDEGVQKLYALVIQEMKAGGDQASITEKLVKEGMDRANASHVVDTIYPQVLKAVREQAFSSEAVMPAVLGGGVAALVGGAVWATVVVVTDYEIGYVAWGIGWLAGFAVVKLAQGRRGTPLQLIAALSALLGILVGKYFIFFHYLKQMLVKEYGADAAAALSPFSVEGVQTFAANISSMLSGFDILWVFLAVATAWAMPRGLGIKMAGYAPAGTTGLRHS
jgi:hypothetical protein